MGESVIDAYCTLTTRPPSDTVIRWLDRLTADHAEPDVVKVMAAEWSEDPNPADFLGRVQTRLAVLARSRTRADEQQRKAAPLRDLDAVRRRYEQASPEEQAKTDAARQRVAAMVGELAEGMES